MRTSFSLPILGRPIGVPLLALLLASTPAAAETPADTSPPTTRVAVDAMLECERPDGGWMYVCFPEHGLFGVTKIVNLAAQTQQMLGLEPWDLVVLRSPGTPAAGLLLLEAWHATGEPRYLEAARRNGDLLVNLQLPSGGWFSEMPVHGNQLAGWFKWTVSATTLDDDVTTGAVRFLLALWEDTRNPRYRDAAERGLDLLLESELLSGGWPLTHRPPILRLLSPSFEDLPSLNDAATTAVIRTLVAGSRTLNRPDLLEAAKRGGDWLVATRREAPAAGWAQQYDLGGHPVPGRRFEPAALASWETRHAMEALVELAGATGDPSYCEAVAESADWLMKSALAPGCWSRFVSSDTGEPIFLDAQGVAVSTPDEAKRPYRWVGDYGIPALLASLGIDTETAVPRLPGDSGDCPGAQRSTGPRHLTRNPRARIGEVGSLLAGKERTESPCRVRTRTASHDAAPLP
ncbi:MAG: hypothetical protein FJ144_20515 [Deltaproteobacteria bacterium]|nr:hypothetical protein [Deltaproteobacteria bacterium]